MEGSKADRHTPPHAIRDGLFGVLSHLHIGSLSHPPLSETEGKVLSALHEEDGQAIATLVEKTGLEASAVEDAVHHLEQLHGLKRDGDRCFLPAESTEPTTQSSADRLGTNALHYIRWQVLSAGIKLGLQLLMARWLGVSHYGVFSLITSTSYVLGTVAALGFPEQLARLVPLYLQQKQYPLLNGYLRFALATPLKLGFLFFLIGIPVIFIAEGATEQTEEWITGLLLIPIIALGLVIDGALAARKLWFASFIQSILVPVLFCGGAFVVTHFFKKEEMEIIFVVQAFVYLIGLTIGWRLLRKAFPKEVWQADLQQDKKMWLKTAGQILIIAAFLVVLLRADLLVVGFLKGKHAAGLYNASISLLMVLPLWANAINAVTNPEISPLVKSGDRVGLQRLITRGIRLSFLPTLIIGLIYIIFGRYFLSLFGEGFEEGYPVLVIMTMLYIGKAASGNPGYLLMMAGKPLALTKILAYIMMFDVVLLFALTPAMGIEGAASATLIAVFASRMLLARSCRKSLGIRVSMFVPIRRQAATAQDGAT